MDVCAKGHPYDEENTGWLTRKSGSRAGDRQRYCKACNRENVYRVKSGVERPAEPGVSLSRSSTPICRRGHDYDEENTKFDRTTGKRRCRKCERINDLAAKAKRKARAVDLRLSAAKV